MRTLENINPGTKFEHIDWVNEGLKLAGSWVAAIVPADDTGRVKTLCISDYYSHEAVQREALNLWPTYLGWDKKPSTS
eukprot:1545238-Alexandrium_andersonii.AAC.1